MATYVTKPYLPKRETLNRYIDRIYDTRILTNNGPLVQELTERLRKQFNEEYVLLVANGTLALQIAYKALNITGWAITTPFTFVATASTLSWQNIGVFFGDIDEKTYCIDPATIRKNRNAVGRSSAIVATHVFGLPCDQQKIADIANTNKMKVIYDGAHIFGTDIDLTRYSDATTLSFHATKLFNTGEGGAIVFRDKKPYDKAKELINFGITGLTEISRVGINCKMQELSAALGLSILDEGVDNIIAEFKKRSIIYNDALSKKYQTLDFTRTAKPNYLYFPILFESEKQLLEKKNEMEKNDIFPRRYFCPSLDDVIVYPGYPKCDISRSISKRILCLPIFYDLEEQIQQQIINILS